MKSERDKESGKYGCDGTQKRTRARLPAHLSRHARHSFYIPCHGDQLPLSSYRGQPTQQELPEAHYGLDDAEHRLHRLFSQAVELAPLARFEPMLHPVHRAGRLNQCAGSVNGSFQCG